ncbi:MAG: hypothetical protein WBA46_05820 [Thermomicrobiales bacterium]
MATQCKGTNKRGEPCSAYVPDGHEWCQFHDPALANERRAWSVKGGVNRSNRVRARKELTSDALTPEELIGSLSRTIRGLEAGTVNPGSATAIATVAKAITVIRQSAELAERVKDLEEQAGIVDIRSRRTS